MQVKLMLLTASLLGASWLVFAAPGTSSARPSEKRAAQKSTPLVNVNPTTVVKQPAALATPIKPPNVAPGVTSLPGKVNPKVASNVKSKLFGFADLHTHPMSHLGFGRKAMHGAPDIDILVPGSTTMGCASREKRATTMAEALGNCNATHGGWGTDNTCGDHLRALVINDGLDAGFWHTVGHENNLHNDHPHAGFPAFSHWPHHSSILHQQMWWEWLQRAHAGGLRVLVALTVNSETLAEVLNGDQPWDDKSVADVQIEETRRFVGRHSDFMKIAYSAAEAESIIRDNKLAVILGMEVDKLGNFGKPGVTTNEQAVKRELERLHTRGIRYVFPIHLIDNAFGGSAVYQMLMNMANRHQNGSFYSLVHSDDPLVTYRANFVSDKPLEDAFASLGIYAAMETMQFLPSPCGEFWKGCAPFTVGCCGNYQKLKGILSPAFDWEAYKRIRPGHVNAKSLTPLGEFAVKEMMRLGMIIDVDHMSERALTRAIEIAENIVPGGYPVVMGHNGIRGAGGDERGAPSALVTRIASLGGMMGLGTADVNAADFVTSYNKAKAFFPNAPVGLGTDANGFEPLPHRGPGNQLSADRVATVPGDAWDNPPAALTCGTKKINVRTARIGCLDIQRDPNLTPYAAVACDGRAACSYKAPSPQQYTRMGVTAATRTFCTQAMEVVYRCVDHPQPATSSENFYASFFRETPIASKQRKPNGGEWDYIKEGGVSHYGLMPEFLHEVGQEDASVLRSVMSSADAFVRMWQKVDAAKGLASTGPMVGTQTVVLPSVGGFCPKGVVAGDAEFGGHGPRVRGDIRLAIDATGNRVTASINFRATETVADWSEVRGSWTVNVGEPAPPGYRYAAIVGTSVGTFDQTLQGGGRVEPFEGCDGGEHIVSVLAGGREFARMLVVGDTGGADISSDANCNCDTRIQAIELNPVRLTLARR